MLNVVVSGRFLVVVVFWLLARSLGYCPLFRESPDVGKFGGLAPRSVMESVGFSRLVGTS